MDNIVILTGAGVSAESGLGTFRDVGGLWDQYDLEEVATPQGFARDPAKVHAFYNARRANMAQAAPNASYRSRACEPSSAQTSSRSSKNSGGGSGPSGRDRSAVPTSACSAWKPRITSSRKTRP